MIENKFDLEQPNIPKNDEGYIEQVLVNLGESNIKKLEIKIPPKPKMKHEIEMWDSLNKFEEDSWKESKNGLKTGYKSIDDALDGGVRPGFYMIAGDSNLGKSVLCSQIGRQIADNNDNVLVLDFSLDDPKDDRISKIIACKNKILINSVKNPKAYTKYPMMLARRLYGLNNMRELSTKYVIKDASETTHIEKIEKTIQDVLIDLDSNGKGDVQLVVLIDSFHDLTTELHPNYTEKQRFSYLAERCADIAIKYDIAIICTGELRKVNGTFRPTPDEIREAVKIKYEAKAIIMLYSDVHYKGESAEVYFRRKDNPKKQPVVEAHFYKNKFSSFKGRLFFEFYPELSVMQEADEEDSKNYMSLIN